MKEKTVFLCYVSILRKKVDKCDGTRHKTQKLWRQHFLVFQTSKIILANRDITQKHGFHLYLVFMLNPIMEITHTSGRVHWLNHESTSPKAP